jgi:1,4-dihydroxy-2-naphthoyl-CoA hydrolase
MADNETRDAAAILNEGNDGWAKAMGLRFVSATADEVVGELTVGRIHLQPYGIVHGGVHCGIIETLASVGGAIFSMPRGQRVVGLENHTSFVRAVREGAVLRGVARPLTRGRHSQLWEVAIADQGGRPVASGRVRVLCLEPEAVLAGERAATDSRG